MTQYNTNIVDLLHPKIPISILQNNSIGNEYILESLTRLKEWENSKVDKSRVSGTI